MERLFQFSIILIIAIVALSLVIFYNYIQPASNQPLSGNDGNPPDGGEQKPVKLERADISHLPEYSQNIIVKNKDKCVQENPGLAEETCLNIALKNVAIENNDESLCNLITSGKTKEICERYFKFNP